MTKSVLLLLLNNYPFLFEGLKISSNSCVKDDCEIVFTFLTGLLKTWTITVDGVEVTGNLTGHTLSAKAPAPKVTHRYELRVETYDGQTENLDGQVREDKPVESLTVDVTPK